MDSVGGKLSPRDRAIIAGTVIALLVAGFVIYRFFTADQPHPINAAPKNPPRSSKMIEMEIEKKGATSNAPADTTHFSGDDIQPPVKK